MIRRLAREIDFARHVPIRQITARARRLVRQRIDRVRPPKLGDFHLRLSNELPLPVMRPRRASLTRGGDGWHYDALGYGAAFPATIDWHRPGPAGRDQLWRMTLHYMEYLEALDDEAFTDVVDQWIAANPPFTPAAVRYSWNPYALSLRVVVWMQQYAARSRHLPPRLAEAMVQSLAEQLDYLERHVELDIGGNHLLKNIKALLWGSAFFDGLRADRWRRRATVLLDRELDIQFLGDGMHYERSPSYHCQVFADLVEIERVLPEGSMRNLVARWIRDAGEVIALLIHPDGLVCQFSDAGLSMAYPPGECLAAMPAIEPGFMAPPLTGAFALPDAGYFGFRGDACFVVVDAGPIAPDSLPAHGHGDIGSFELSLGSQRIFVDQGVFEYLEGPRRAQSRSASAHNTLSIAGMDQASFFGAFRSAFRARIVQRRFDPKPDGFALECEHDGFHRTGGGPRHRRLMVIEGKELRIEDHLSQPADRPAHIGLLLHPDVTAEQGEGADGAGQILLSHAKGRAIVTCSHPIAVEEGVWWPDIGSELPTTRLRATLPAGQVECRMRVTWTET